MVFAMTSFSTAISFGVKTLRPQAHKNLFLRSTSLRLESANPNVERYDSLSFQLANAYKDRESDGVQDFIKMNSNLLREHSARDFLLASIEATSTKIGDTATIMNSLIASCVNFSDPDEFQSRKALELLEIMERSEESTGIKVKPDIVSYCCAFSACSCVSKADANQRMDHVASNEAQTILDKIQQMSKKQAGGKRRKAMNTTKRKLRRSDTTISEPDLSSVFKQILEPYDVSILFENENYIAINKPSSMICYHRHRTTKGKHKDVSLEEVLLKCNQAVDGTLSTLNPEALGIVHRLDRGTSGCILIAKNNQAHALLLTAFFKREVKKSYIALIPAKAQIKSKDDPLGVGDSGLIDIPVDGKPALSSYTIEHIYSSPPEAIAVRLETFTGRKHQVRVHCAMGLNRPIFLEPLYKSDGTLHVQKQKKQKKKKSIPSTSSLPPKPIQNAESKIQSGHRFFLHAQSLQVPFLGIQILAPLPEWWEETVIKFHTK